jgi:sugar lactone lactonase YvrE
LKSQPRQISQSLEESTHTQTRRPIRRLIVFFLALGSAIVLIIGVTGLLLYNSFSRTRHDGKALTAGITVEPFVSLPGDSVFPIGLAAAPEGTFYLTQFGTGSIIKVDANGTTTSFVQSKDGLTAPAAIAVGPDNALYVIDLSTKNPYQAVGTLLRITTDTSGVKLARFGVSPNGKALPLFAQMTFDSAGNLYVTNPSSGEIWQFTPSGRSVVWWVPPSVAGTAPQPTAIAFDQAKNALIIGDAGTGSIYRVNLVTSGPVGNPLVMYRQPGLEVQGLTLDDQGRILIAVWAHDNGQLIRLEQDGSLVTLADGFRAPMSIAYKAGKVYVVNSDVLGLVPPLFFGLIPSPLRAKPPFTVDVVSIAP